MSISCSPGLTVVKLNVSNSSVSAILIQLTPSKGSSPLRSIFKHVITILWVLSVGLSEGNDKTSLDETPMNGFSVEPLATSVFAVVRGGGSNTKSWGIISRVLLEFSSNDCANAKVFCELPPKLRSSLGKSK